MTKPLGRATAMKHMSGIEIAFAAVTALSAAALVAAVAVFVMR